jgi:hypothetical protein
VAPTVGALALLAFLALGRRPEPARTASELEAAAQADPTAGGAAGGDPEAVAPGPDGEAEDRGPGEAGADPAPVAAAPGSPPAEEEGEAEATADAPRSPLMRGSPDDRA